MIPREIWGRSPRLISRLHQGAPFDHQHVLGRLAYQGPSPSKCFYRWLYTAHTFDPNLQNSPICFVSMAYFCTAASSFSVQTSVTNVKTWTGNQLRPCAVKHDRPTSRPWLGMCLETTTVMGTSILFAPLKVKHMIWICKLNFEVQLVRIRLLVRSISKCSLEHGMAPAPSTCVSILF